jgi:alkanesulfonate monooxygenase SsuD/methylene tetrahydromethanopterin reductase-like flavin-dependent oxidoreductase (luciferase family)
LREQIEALGYTHDASRLAPAAALVPDTFVDAVTLAGTVEEVTARVSQLQQMGITHVLINPLAPDDDVEQVIRVFAHEVMPQVNEQPSV